MPRKAADSTTYSVVGHSHHPWEPGLSKLPYRGLGALFLSVAGVVVAIIVLLVSDGADVNRWRFQPSVYVAIASTVTNVTVAYALMEGVSISWWHKATKDGTNVADLHRIWACGTSFVSALLCGRHVNLVAIASLLVAISAINGPLLQRASTIGPANVDSTQRLQIEVAKLVPKGFTGIQTSRANQVNMLTTEFSPIAKDYYNKVAIPLKSGCIDNCRTSVLGAGFHANCSTYQAPFNATPGLDVFPSATMFGATMAYAVAANPVAASLNIQYKPKAGCVGESTVINCSLTAGTVLYKVVINGPASSIALAPGTTIWDDIVVGKPDYLGHDEDTSGVPSTYGGIFLALANQFNTNLQLQFGGGIGWEYLGAQSEASISYAHNISEGGCDIYFSDPTEDFLQSTRELMFRTAILSANETNIQHVSAQVTGSHTVYHTNYLFVALATLVSALAIVAVLLTFQGSQRLGREVSMSPIEVAKAFGAPLLRGANSNARASALVKEVGHRPLKYGVVSDTKLPRKPVANRFSRTPYTDEVPYGNGDTELDSGYSNALPAEPQQLANRSSRTPRYANESPYNNFSPDLGFSNTIPTDRHQQQQEEHATVNSHLHTSWQTGQSSGFESDVELIDSRQRSDSSRTWLEIANPKIVAPLKSGMSFSDW